MSGAALPDRQGFDLLPKPFTHEDLIRRTEEALGA
jgi:hypothetical protein